MSREVSSNPLDVRGRDHLGPLSMSAATRLLNSSGVEGFGSLPSALSRATTAGSASTAAISLFSRFTMSSGRPAGSDHALPGADDEILDALFGDGRDIRQREEARGAGRRQRAQLAALDRFEMRRRRIEHEVEALAEQVGHRLRAAAIRHQLHADVRGARQQLDRQMLQRSVRAAVEQRLLLRARRRRRGPSASSPDARDASPARTDTR